MSGCPECGNDEDNTFDFHQNQLLLKCSQCGRVWRPSTGEVKGKFIEIE